MKPGLKGLSLHRAASPSVPEGSPREGPALGTELKEHTVKNPGDTEPPSPRAPCAPVTLSGASDPAMVTPLLQRREAQEAEETGCRAPGSPGRGWTGTRVL